MRLAYFITPHGFGHAARAAAVMVALQKLTPDLEFDIVTQVPAWFFQDSQVQHFDYHEVYTDIGLIQRTSLQEDVPATVERLNRFLPFDQALVTHLADIVRTHQCALVLCDIAPLGIRVAQHAGVPSVLIESFTWDWIYQGYVQEDQGLLKHMDYLRQVFLEANYRVQMEPAACPAPVDLRTAPVSRAPRQPAALTRAQLGIPEQARMVFLSMGGIPDHYTFLNCFAQWPEVHFVVSGMTDTLQRQGNTVLLPHRSQFFNPDLIAASDVVISKIGYSTMAEAYAAGVPFGYVLRPRFRECEVLSAYANTHMPSLAFHEEAFRSGAWLAQLPTLLALPRQPPRPTRGAEQLAQFLHGLSH